MGSENTIKVLLGQAPDQALIGGPDHAVLPPPLVGQKCGKPRLSFNSAP